MLATPNKYPRSPDSLEGQPPIYFAGGLGYNNARNQGVLHQIEGLGHDVVPALNDPNVGSVDTGFRMVVNGIGREVSRREAWRLAPKSEVSTSNFQQDRATELLNTLERDGKQPVDAIFQSADALNGLLAAYQQPDRFNNIVLAYPAGLVRQPNIRRAAPKVVPAEAMVRLKPKHLINKKIHGFEAGRREKSKNVGGFTIASTVGLSQQSKLLHEMRQKENAPGVAIVAGADDIMLSPKKVFESLESPDDVDLVLVADTTHGLNNRRDVLESIVDLLPKVEEIKQARQAEGQNPTPLTDRVLFFGRFSAEKRQQILQQAALVDARTSATQPQLAQAA